MWGNALGWTISLVIVAITAAALLLFQRHLANVTPVTEFARDAARLGPIALPDDPAALLPPADNFDAGPIYRQAIEVVLADSDAYEDFATSGRNSERARDLAALELLRSAARCAQMSLFTGAPDELIRYGRKPELHAIHLAGKSANKLGALLTYEKRFDDAIAQHEAAFALGARLYEERLTLDELLAGLELMSEAAGGIAAASAQAGDEERARAFSDFRSRYGAYHRSRIQPLQRVVSSIDPGVIAQHSGDLFYVAQDAQERMWRIEAILALGRLRFNAARLADQRAAERFLERLSQTDPDPLIRAAATAARKLTVEKYRMLG